VIRVATSGVPDVPAAGLLVTVPLAPPIAERRTHPGQELPLRHPGAQEPRDLSMDPDAGLTGEAQALNLERGVDAHQPPDHAGAVDQLGAGHQLAEAQEVGHAEAEGHAVPELEAEPAAREPELGEHPRHLVEVPDLVTGPRRPLDDRPDVR